MSTRRADSSPARAVSAGTWMLLGLASAVLPLVVLGDRLTLAGLWPATPPLQPGSPASPRVSQPLGYWNALGVWCAVACLVQLMSAAHAGHRIARRAAGAAVPLLLATGYLTYSRGAILAAAIGLVAALWLAPRRRALLLQLGATLVPSAVAIGAVALDTGVAFGSATAHPWTVGVLAVAAGAGALLADRAGGASAFLRAEVAQERVAGWIDRRVGRPLAMLLLTAVVIGGAAFAIRSVVEGFDAPYRPTVDVRDRFSDTSSGGRTLLWHAAWDSFRAHPSGTGTDTFRVTFDQVAPLQFTARDAHSVYLERLAEHGVEGLLLFVALMAVATATLVCSRRTARGSAVRGGLVATAAAGLTAIMLGAGIDWYWEIPAVRALAFAMLAAGLVPLAIRAARDPWMPEPRWTVPLPVRALPALVALVAAAAQFVPNQADRALADSQRAASAGDLAEASNAADRAVAAEPERPDGYTQRGLLAEASGRPSEAIVDLQLALHRSPGRGDWRLFALLARAHAEAGEPKAALAAMAEGRRARPNGRFFRLNVPDPNPAGLPRACSGDVRVELEHCERLPRVDGTFELPHDATELGQRQLPDNTIRDLLQEAVSADKHRRDAAVKLFRLLDSRPAPPNAVIAEAAPEGDGIYSARVPEE
ncbi:MAG: O-antigen ligase family protein [Solirubrobacteraceae bacterium]|nr:O-antigen ligase family protein [Solirubrobacteraceae bacterium]